jgi:hypothetical protein
MTTRLWIVGLFCCVSLLGQEQKSNNETDKTFELLNGHDWTKLTSNERLFLLTGLADGWTFREETEDTANGSVLNAWGFAGNNFQYTDLVKMIDLSYAEPENLTLPVCWVVMASMAIQRGDTTRDVVLTALRKFMASITSGELYGSHPASEWPHGVRPGPNPGEVSGPANSPVDTILKLKRKP